MRRKPLYSLLIVNHSLLTANFSLRFSQGGRFVSLNTGSFLKFTSETKYYFLSCSSSFWICSLALNKSLGSAETRAISSIASNALL